MADAYVQDGKDGKNRLKINTILDNTKIEGQSDPLLLVAVQGDEYLSQPFKFTVTVWRDIALNHVQPEQMINTKARFGIDIKEYQDRQVITAQGVVTKEIFVGQSYVYRCGVIDEFSYETVIDDRFFQYKATIVPRFSMLKYDTCFRIWQDKKFTDIIDDFESIFYTDPPLKFDKSFIKEYNFPEMEYCCQFDESSFNFLSRLMQRFGVWYYITHDPDTQTNTVVLGRLDSKISFHDCKINDPQGTVKRIDPAKMWRTDKNRSLFGIVGFNHQYATVVRRYNSGDFNTLQPQKPFSGVANIDQTHDWIEPTVQGPGKPAAKPPNDYDRFRTEVFPQQAESNDLAAENAKVDLFPQEAVSVVGTGTTANPAFCAGYQFHFSTEPPPKVASQSDNSPDIVLNKESDDLDKKQDTKVKNYVILSNHIAAREDAYLSHPGIIGGIADFFVKFWHRLLGDSEVVDVLGNFTNQGVGNYLQNQLPLNFGQPPSGPAYQFVPFLLGGGTAALAAILPALLKGLVDLGKDHSTFSNSFTAIPLDWTNAPRSMPVPREGITIPKVQGPHLATVIGKQGTHRIPGNNVYNDALGRVRIRFPWHWMDNPPYQKKWEDDAITCWVRVTQGWAGRHFGMQFIPRVGEEVIVDFIGGDPDRPIITGRVYNADDGKNNPPFLDEVDVKKIADLPPTAKTDLPYTGLKTWSIPSHNAKEELLSKRFHLLRFDDTRDKEQYLIRSQRRLDITAFEKRYESIGSDRHLTVGAVGGTQSTSSEAAGSGGGGGDGGSYLAAVTAEYHLSVGGARKTLVKEDDNLQVNRSSSELVGGNWSVTVGGPKAAAAIADSASAAAGPTPTQISQAAAKAAADAAKAGSIPSQATIDVPGLMGTIVLNSQFNISLTVGTSSIVLTPAAIFITSTAINLNGPVLGAPPVPPPVPIVPLLPRDAGAVKPKQPTPADTGDTLVPPKDAS